MALSNNTVFIKKVVSISLIVLIAVCTSFSLGISETDQGIAGLGELKLGMTFDDFQAWLKDRNITIGEVRDSTEEYSKKRSGSLVVYRPRHNDAEPYASPSDVNYVPNHDSIVVSTYSVGDIKIDDIYLLFKNDILIKIRTKLSDKLEVALTAKYGDPIVEIETKTITCTFTYTGATQEKSESTTYSTWRDDTIKAYGTTLYFYNSKCQLLGGKTLDIYNKNEYSDYSMMNWQAENEYEELIESRKRENLKKTLDKL